jgi:hypothetical protein
MTERGNAPAPPPKGRIIPGAGGDVLLPEPAVSGPCVPLFEQWVRLRAACEQATARAEEAERKRLALQAELSGLEDQWGKDVGGSNEGATWQDGEGYTFEDYRLLRADARAAFRNYRANPTPETAKEAQQVGRRDLTPETRDRLRREQAAARARIADLAHEIAELAGVIEAASEVCAEAAAAKHAYDECCHAATAAPLPPPVPIAEDPGKPDPGRPDDPRDAGASPGSPCPPGSETWQPCGAVEHFDAQRDDARVLLEVKPAIGSVYGYLQYWSPGYHAKTGDTSFACEVPQRALEADLGPKQNVNDLAAQMFRDLLTPEYLSKTWVVSIRATFSYVHTGWTCMRRCDGGTWEFKAFEVERKEETNVIERSWSNTTDLSENCRGIGRILQEIGAFAANLYGDFLNEDRFQARCRTGDVCAGRWQRVSAGDLARPR